MTDCYEQLVAELEEARADDRPGFKHYTHKELRLFRDIEVRLELASLRMEVEKFFKTQKGAAKKAVCAVLLSKIRKRESNYRSI